MTVHLAKTQISLDICPVWSESSLFTQSVAKDPSILHVDSEDSDQTGWMPRLIRVFAGRKDHFVGFVMSRLKCLNHSLIIFHYSFKKSIGMCFVWFIFPDSSKLTVIKGRRWMGADAKPGSGLVTALLLYLKLNQKWNWVKWLKKHDDLIDYH